MPPFSTSPAAPTSTMSTCNSLLRHCCCEVAARTFEIEYATAWSRMIVTWIPASFRQRAILCPDPSGLASVTITLKRLVCDWTARSLNQFQCEAACEVHLRSMQQHREHHTIEPIREHSLAGHKSVSICGGWTVHHAIVQEPISKGCNSAGATRT